MKRYVSPTWLLFILSIHFGYPYLDYSLYPYCFCKINKTVCSGRCKGIYSHRYFINIHGDQIPCIVKFSFGDDHFVTVYFSQHSISLMDLATNSTTGPAVLFSVYMFYSQTRIIRGMWLFVFMFCYRKKFVWNVNILLSMIHRKWNGCLFMIDLLLKTYHQNRTLSPVLWYIYSLSQDDLL